MAKKITKEHILKADGDELSRLLGEVLLSEQHGHVVGQSIEEMQFSYYHCTTCGEVNFETDSHCTLRPLIPLDWDNAMKWRDWAIKEYGWETYTHWFHKVVFEKAQTLSSRYMIAKCQPVDYLQAAAICKLNAEKGN